MGIPLFETSVFIHLTKISKSSIIARIDKSLKLHRSCPEVVDRRVFIDDLTCKDQFSFEVQNVGEHDGSKVVIVLLTFLEGIATSYIKQVNGF